MTVQAQPGVLAHVAFFKALGNPIRAQIVEFLLSGERCVCEMTGPLDVSQPLVSHHLGLLRDAGLVQQRNEGTRTYYSLDWERFEGELGGFLQAVEALREQRTATGVEAACWRSEAADNACATTKGTDR